MMWLILSNYGFKKKKIAYIKILTFQKYIIIIFNYDNYANIFISNFNHI